MSFGIGARVVIELGRVVRHHRDRTGQVGEHLVGDIGFHLRGGAKVLREALVHGALDRLRYRLLLLDVRLCDQAPQLRHLPENDCGIGCDNQKDRKQNEVERLLLYATLLPIPELFHTFPFT